ncbi:MAG: hypothetical protein PVG83_09535 [Acidimicrobiia bacterium]
MTFLAFLVAVSGCSEPSATAEEAVGCDELVDVAVQAVVDARDAAVGTAFETFDLLRDEARSILEDLVETHDAVELRARDLGCGDDALEAYHKAVLDIAPLSDGGIRVIERAVVLPPFAPSPE